jgi:hypothetical protein
MEPLSSRQTEVVKCEELSMNVKSTAARFQAMELEIKELQVRAAKENEDFEDRFRASIDIHVKETTKLVKILSRMLGEVANPLALPKILLLMEQCDSREERIHHWAITFGYLKENKGTKRKAK